MRTLLIATMLAVMASPSAAEVKCYQHDLYPDWTITVFDPNPEPGEHPDWLWKMGGRTVGLWEMGTGTESPVRVAFSEDDKEGGRYMFYKGALIFDMDIYEPVACK